MTKVTIINKDLAGRTLKVSKEVSEDGKLVLDAAGKATVDEKAALSLCTVPGFSIEEKKPGKNEGLKQQQNDASGQSGDDEGPEDQMLYPEGDPNPTWKKKELAEWLTEKGVEFEAKDGKEVLLGKAFKVLESKASEQDQK